MSLIVLIGKSASGKTYIANKLSENFRYEKLVTCTTRPPRNGEVDGKDYYFIDEESFREGMEDGIYICTTKYNNWYYGIPVDELKKDNQILIIEPIGYYELLRVLPQEVNMVSFYIDCGDRERLIRQLKRGDDVREIFLRFERDVACFQNVEKFVDKVISANDDEWNCVCAVLEGVKEKNENN